MEYHIAICYPGMDEKVMEGIHEYGFNTFQVTLPSTRSLDQGIRVRAFPTPARVRAFPGYLFIDTRLNPYIHPVDGMMDILMQGAEYAKVDEQSLLEIQWAVNQMAEHPDTGDVFERYFSGNREMDFFDTPGTVIIENTVNLYRHRKMEQVR